MSRRSHWSPQRSVSLARFRRCDGTPRQPSHCARRIAITTARRSPLRVEANGPLPRARAAAVSTVRLSHKRGLRTRRGQGKYLAASQILSAMESGNLEEIQRQFEGAEQLAAAGFSSTHQREQTELLEAVTHQRRHSMRR